MSGEPTSVSPNSVAEIVPGLSPRVDLPGGNGLLAVREELFAECLWEGLFPTAMPEANLRPQSRKAT